MLLTKKENYPGKMLIEQFIEFKLREIRPPNRTFTPKTGYSHVKAKISQGKYMSDFFFSSIFIASNSQALK